MSTKKLNEAEPHIKVYIGLNMWDSNSKNSCKEVKND